MAMSVKTGTITAKTSTGNQAYTGIGFQPMAIIFFATPQSTTGYITRNALAVGFAASSSQRKCCTFAAESGVAGGSSKKTQSDTAISIMKTGAVGTLGIDADLVSFDADGFTLNFTTADGTAYIINYLALGGTDLTNVFVGGFQMSSSTTTQAFTGVGFQPDAMLMMTMGSGTFPLAAGNHATFGLGAAISASAEGAMSYRDNNSATPTSLDSTYQRTSNIISTLSSTADTLLIEANLASFDADGFTLNTPTTSLNAYLFALCLKGGSYAVTNDTQKTSTGTQAKTGAGFQPKAMFMFGANGVVSSSVVHNSNSIGATDGTTDVGIWGGAVNAANPSTNASSLHAKVLRHSTPSSTTNAEASISSLDADGYTLNWTTADATAREFISMSIGNNPPTPRIGVNQAIRIGV